MAEPEWTLDTQHTSNALALSGTWLARTGNIPQFPQDGLKSARQGPPLTFETSHLETWDTGLIAFLWDLKRISHDAHIDLALDTLPDAARQLLALLPDAPEAPPNPHATSPPLLEKTGALTLDSLTEIGATSQLAVTTANGALRTLIGKSPMRLTDLMANMKDAGPSALIIVGIVNFLIGAILAFVGGVQLQKFAADIYVASLVGIAMVREMAAVMTAIIMAGRTGGAYAARIATMQGTEEIDALNVFGISPTTYLILPAVLSLTTTMPFLYLYGCLIGMLGGFVVALSMLSITGIGYLHQTLIAFGISQFLFGLVKSIVFGAFIGLTSCRIGLKAGRSASDVGIAATRAVVVGIVGVIAIDAVFAVLANTAGL